jgi:hypothetical protein
MQKQKNKKTLLVLIICISLVATYSFFTKKNSCKQNATTLKTLYGTFTITEPILIDLLNSQAVLRMKELKQFGILHHIQDFGIYNRYIHSVGVFVLLRKYGASIEEQVAGLLHDVSHTAFSHLSDTIFANKSDIHNSYQDNIHEWFLERTDIPKIIAKYDYTINDFMHKSGKFFALEQKLPDLCADRLEYFLYEHALQQGGANKTKNKEFTMFILDNLHFENNTWYFSNIDAALAYANLTLNIPQTSWMSKWSKYVSNKAAKMIKRAVEIKLIDQSMIHFGTDQEILAKLTNCSDPQIKNLMYKICNHAECYNLGSKDNHTLCLKRKFKGVDPYVQTKNGLQRLTKLDSNFAKKYNSTKVEMLKKIYLKELS